MFCNPLHASWYSNPHSNKRKGKQYINIAEQFKSDDEFKISAETEDVDVTEEVHHISENRTNFDRDFLSS